ncbi:dsDNA nuclease domain-containing protein [Yersinia bercovieri]|uniref:dsDNA nuclease domain-containing protein n=1 Tax=Yersinia bercovieri TaxID=634 RepID=UPI0005E12222|nr:dsDNA nuclease domain-containing protein [Yersinia bercovieri]CFQ34246.1 Uncharacterised protein [Yersinia bercovieri]HEN3655332.1 DUF4297 domain-containing protein [Yersinia enterocolitica]
MVLETVPPREQSGRDSFARYRAQVRSAAIAALQMLSSTTIDRVYCDLHDDVVVRKKDENGLTYVFYQVKTRAKQNKNWTLGEVFGIQPKKNTICDKSIKESFVGKMLLHTIIFDRHCNSVIFQTNIHNDDNIEDLLSDIENGIYANKFSRIFLERFNNIYPNEIATPLSENEIKERLSKLKFENDVHYLKDDSSYFAPLARERIYQYSEIDLTHIESNDIIIKLLELISSKSSGVIKPFTKESIENSAAVSINDLLPLLSLSKEAYEQILQGGDPKAIKSVSIIQRTLLSAGASLEDVTFCSKCKTEWDVWYRNNRHNMSEIDLRFIVNKVRELLRNVQSSKDQSLTLGNLYTPLKQLLTELKSLELEFDLTTEMLFGAVFSELVKGGI